MQTMTGLMIEQREKDFRNSVGTLLEQEYIKVGSNGFKIDVLKLVDELSTESRNDLVRYIVAKYGYKNKD